MSIKGVLRNIKNKGVSGTYDLYRNKKVIDAAKEKYLNIIIYDERQYEERPFLAINDKNEYKGYMLALFEKEKELRATDGKLYKKYCKDMKALYVKKRIPELYDKLKDLPVEDKVIFMENGNSPSPSSSLISSTMQKEGKYTVHKTGLKIRQVSEVEYYENAMRFIDDMATAKAVFLSTANDLLSHFDVRHETKIIQLWHGVGVFKKVGYSTIDNKNFGKNAKEREEYYQYRNYSYVTIPSPEQSWIFEESMRIDKDSGVIVPVGVSRTDVFYDEKYIKETYDKLHRKLPQTAGKKIILYAPTFRGAVADAKAPDQLDIDAFGEALSDDYILLVKHHGLSKDVPKIPEKWRDKFAFDMGANKILGIERLLSIADICITDYSSIAFEYAIMERPLIFFAYDIEDYIDKRGMYYDYEEITPGPVCKTNGEMIDYIMHIKERFDKQEIKDFKEKYVGCCDGHSTERTIALIEK